MDKIVGISEFRKSMAAIINEVFKGSKYIIMQRSKPKAVIMSPMDVETLEVMADKELLEDIKSAKREILNRDFVSYEEFFGKKLPDNTK